MTESMIVTYLARCYQLATHSQDPSNQNAALILSTNRIVEAINDFPTEYKLRKSAAEIDAVLRDRDQKLLDIEHAERNAVYLAANHGVPCNGATMFCPWAPCQPCAKAIVQSGIKILVTHKQRCDETPERWAEDVRYATQYAKDNGVKVIEYDGYFEAPTIIVNGHQWSPAMDNLPIR